MTDIEVRLLELADKLDDLGEAALTAEAMAIRAALFGGSGATVLELFVQGLPRSKGSKRGIPLYRGKKGQPKEFTGRVAMLDQSSEALKDWEGHVRYQAMMAWGGRPALDEPLEVTLSFRLKMAKKPRPNLAVWPARDPDLEKLARGVLDAMQTVVFVDDNLICRQPLEKVWGDPPGVQVTVRRLVL